MSTITPTEKPCLIRGIASLLVILFVLSAVAAVFMFNASTMLLQRETYKRALIRQNVYASMPALAAEQITYGSSGDCAENVCQAETAVGLSNFLGIPADYLMNLDRQRWEIITGILMPPDWLQSQTESVIDQFFDDLESPNQSVRASLSLGSMRAGLTDDDYRAVSRTILETAPVCNADQLLNLAAIFMGLSSDNPPFCVPTEEYRGLMENQVDSTVRDLIARLPADATLNAARLTGLADGDVQAKASVMEDRYRGMRTTYMISPLLPLFALLLLGVVAVRSWYDAGRWLGIPLVAAGVIVLALSAVLMLAGPWLVSDVILSRLTAQVSTSIVQVIENVTRTIGLRYIFWNAIAAGVFFLSGAGLLLASAMRQPRRMS